MSKHKRGRRRRGEAGAAAATPSRGGRRPRARALALTLCVAAACVVGAAQLGFLRWAGTNAPPAQPAPPAQGGGNFSPSSPSKEYVYAGGRLVATEEPGGAVQAPFGGAARAVPGTIQSEDFDEGGEGVAYHDTDPTDNVMNGYRPDPSGVDLEECGDVGGGYNVGYAWTGEWLEYTVEVASAGVYTLEARVAYGAGTGGTFHVEFDGVDKTGPLTVPNTGGWQTYQTVTEAGVSLTAGTHVMRVALDAPAPAGGLGNFNYVRLTPEAVGPAPTGLVAEGVSTSSVTLHWAAPSASVVRYQVERNSGGGFALVAEPTASPYTESGLAPDTSHLYRVRAVYAGGYSNYGDADLATTIVFTDQPLLSGITPIKAVHLNELRRAVGAVRALAGLGPPSWTYPDPVSTPSEQRRRIYLEDVTELRARLDEALTALGRWAPYPSDPPLARYAPVRKEFFMQIRERVE